MTFQLPEYEDIVSVEGTFKQKKITVYVKIAPFPFATGAVRLAYHARAYTDASLNESTAKHVVMKLMKYTGEREGKYKHYIQELEAATVAAKLAIDYNAEIARKRIRASPIRFGVVRIAQFTQDPTDHNSASSSSSKAVVDEDRLIFNKEAYIDGTYEKFTTNSGFVEDSDLAREFSSFSHWSWSATNCHVMVVDLQGVKNGKSIMLTDPAVHAYNLHRYGKTNLGEKGMLRFFKTHTCSALCKALGIDTIRPRSEDRI